MKSFLMRLFDWIETLVIVRAIRKGFIMAIPVLMIGSFCLVLNNLPIQAYQDFIKVSFYNGIISNIFVFMYNGTFGILSLYIVIFISISYAQINELKAPYIYGAPLTALACFVILSGVFTEGVTVSVLGVTGLFNAVLSSYLASLLYTKLAPMRSLMFKAYSDGADADFNNTISAIFPAAITILIFAVFNMIIVLVFKVSGFQELFINFANRIFHNMGRTLFSSMLYLFVSSILWFFGVHGSDVLENVSDTLFVPAIDMNAAAVAAGQPATEIFSKTFFDVFILMGGCGTALCLLVALLIGSKQRSSKNLSKMAALPMLFNINEPMVYGLPIAFNPIMFIPFILTPIALLLVSTAAVKLGLVPVPVAPVNWTTPIFWGGYIATGSISGAILQLVNLGIGTCIYMPFVRMYDEEKLKSAHRKVEYLWQQLQESQKKKTSIVLTAMAGTYGSTAKMLGLDIKHAIANDEFMLYYQPQYDHMDNCIGAEALLRWNHPIFGMIEPPLIIRLAEEMDLLYELECCVIKRAISDSKVVFMHLPRVFNISVNVTVKSLEHDDFEEFLQRMVKKYDIQKGRIGLEITEQMALQSKQQMSERLNRIHQMGYQLVVDDFSMGHTSLKYLQNNHIDMVKLDGEMIRDIHNLRNREIIDSIIYLSRSLHFTVLAEFVETREQRDFLKELGCLAYQGYYYSPAISLDDLLKLLG